MTLRRRRRHRDRVVAVVRQIEVHELLAAIGVRVRTQAVVPLGGKGRQLGEEAAGGIEYLLGPVAPHPGFQDREMLEVVLDAGDRHLVGAEGPLHGLSVDDLGPRPALRGPQHQGRPAGTAVDAPHPRGRLDLPDPPMAGVQRRGEGLVDTEGFVALDEEDLVPVARDQLPDLLVGRSPEHGRARDLVAIQVENGQNRAVPGWVEEADSLPAAFERSRLGLAVADHGGDDEIWVVEGGAEGMDQHVAELATLVDRPGSGHAHVARDPAGG